MNRIFPIFPQFVFLFTASTALASSTEYPQFTDSHQVETVDIPLNVVGFGSPTTVPSQNSVDGFKISQLTEPPRQLCLQPEQHSDVSIKPLIRNIQIISFSNSQLKKVISDDDTKNILDKFQHCPATSERLDAIKDAITLLYIERGYITSRAVSSKAKPDGTVLVYILEGKIHDIKITDYAGKLIEQAKYIRSRIQLGIDTPLNIRNLQEQIKLLDIDPLFDENDPLCKKMQNSQAQSLLCEGKNVHAILRASKSGRDGESDLIVKVKNIKFFRYNFSFDNSSPPSIGAERINGNIRFANFVGLSDIFVASFQTAPFHFSDERGVNFIGLGYQVPLNPKNGILQLRWENRREQIIQEPFDSFGLRAQSQLYELVYRQPLISSYSNEFALSLGFTFQNGQTFVFDDTPFPFAIGPDENGVSRTSVITFAQEYIHRGISRTWLLRSQFNLGTSLFGATTNSASIPDGQFISWLGQVQYLQQIGSSNLLIMQGDLQLTTDPLLPSQQFVIGGRQSLRGYRQNFRFGDNGFRFSIEDRITLWRNQARRPIFQIAPFVDIGAVWNHPGNPNKLPNNNLLAGSGLGVLWSPLPQLNIRLDYAIPLIELPSPGDNLQDQGFYFSVNHNL